MDESIKLHWFVSARKKILLFLILCSFSLDTFTNVLVITIAPYMQEALQVSVLSIGMLLSSYPLGAAIGYLLFGNLVNRYGATLIFISGPLLIVSASLASYLVASSIKLLTVLFFIQAIGVAAVGLAAKVLLYQLSKGEPNLLARYYSLQYLSFLLSETLTPVIVTLLLLFSVWENVYLCSAGFALVFVVSSWKFVYNHPTLAVSQLGRKDAKISLLFKNYKFIIYTLVGITSYIWVYIYYVALPYSLRFIFLSSTETYGIILFLNLAAAFLATLVNFYLLRYFSAQRLLIVSAIITFLSSIFMLIATAANFYVYEIFIASFIILSFTVMISLANSSALALGGCSQALVGKASGIFGFSLYMFGFFSSIFTGTLLACFPNSPLAIALWMNFICLAIFLTSLLSLKK